MKASRLVQILRFYDDKDIEYILWKEITISYLKHRKYEEVEVDIRILVKSILHNLKLFRKHSDYITDIVPHDYTINEEDVELMAYIFNIIEEKGKEFYEN